MALDYLKQKAKEKLYSKKAKDVLPTDKEIAEYKRLGGSKTKEGRAYRREWMKKHGG